MLPAPDRAETGCPVPWRRWERWFPERSGPAAWCTPDRTTPPDRIPARPAGSIAPCRTLPCCAPCSRSRSRRCRLAPCRVSGGHWRSGSTCGWPLGGVRVLRVLKCPSAGHRARRGRRASILSSIEVDGTLHSFAFCNRYELPVFGADVVCRWADDLAVAALL